MQNQEPIPNVLCSYSPVAVRRLLCLLLLSLLLSAPPTHAQNNTSHGTYIIAVANDAPPFAVQAANGQLVGFDVDLIKLLVRIAGLRVDYEAAPFVQLIPGVATQLYDGAIGCLWITEERKGLVDFSAAYFSTGTVFVFAENNTPIYDLTDLRPAMTVSTLTESAGWRFLTEQKVATVQAVASAEEALTLAAARVTDAAFIDEVTTDRFIHSHPEARLRVVSGLVTTNQCGIAVSKENPQLLLELNAAMTRLKNNGKYLAIYRRWFGSRPLNGPLPVNRSAPVIATTATLPPATTPTSAAADALIADAAGRYVVTWLTDPSEYQVIELAPNGVWLESQAEPDSAALHGVGSLTTGPLPVQPGRWEVVRTDPLAQTVAISATLPVLATSPGKNATESEEQVTAMQPRKEYQLTIQADGAIRGSYLLYTSGAPTTTALLTATIELMGQRVVE